MAPKEEPRTWVEKSASGSDITAVVPVIPLGPIAGGKFVREIAEAVKRNPERDILGGEEFGALIPALEESPYSIWLMRFGEEGVRPSHQEWHRHVITEKGAQYPDYISHRLLLVTCTGEKAGIERCKVDKKGKATGAVTHYTLQPDTLYAFRFDGDDIHRFTSDSKQTLLAAISFHPLDKAYGKEGMNSQTVMYEGMVPDKTEYVDLPSLMPVRTISELDNSIKKLVLDNKEAHFYPEALSEYLDFVAMPSDAQAIKLQALDLIRQHAGTRNLYLPF